MGEQTKADVVSMRLTEGDKLTLEGLVLDVIDTLVIPTILTVLSCRTGHSPVNTIVIRGTGCTDFQNADRRSGIPSIFGRLSKMLDMTHATPCTPL